MHCTGYVNGLTADQKRIYSDKLNLLGNCGDPYEIPYSLFGNNIDDWPRIEHGDIVNYLVFSTNAVTHEQMKAYKSLEAHNYFTSGWVKNTVFTKVVSPGKVLLLGEVNHSQSLKSPTLKVWTLCTTTGEVVTAHCTCMAGMGSACSHIGAFLFALETGIRMHELQSCTQKANTWLPPSHVKQVPSIPIKELDFSSATTKRRKLNSGSENLQSKYRQPQVPAPTNEEIMHFFKDVKASGVPAAVLSLCSPFNNDCIPKKETTVLTNLYSTDDEETLNWQQVIAKSKEVFGTIKVSGLEAKEIESKTRKQAQCKKWFSYRAGRITASNMKAVCHTDVNNPSLSLIKRICYPSLHGFSTPATKWGCDHEKQACEQYREKCQTHTGFDIKVNGLFIHPEFPHLGATPDAQISCDCCGTGILEIKCPYCSREKNVREIVQQKASCLVVDEAFNVELDRTHAYYYQVQTQLFVCNVDFCDFVVWTKESLHIERIFPDEIFWESICEKSTDFFVHCILPELIARWYSRNK